MANLDSIQTSLFQSAALTQQTQQAQQSQQKKTKVKKSSISSLFSDMLSENLTESISLPDISSMTPEEALVALKDAVDLTAEQLKTKPYIHSFKMFKEALGNFLDFVVKNSYEVEHYQSRRSLKLPRKNSIKMLVHTVNVELDKLASDLIYNHMEQITLTAKVDQIVGLLIDIMT